MNREEYLSRRTEFAARGQDLPQTKLLALDVGNIRSAARQRESLRKHIAENLSNEALAKSYGVHVNTIEKVCVDRRIATWPSRHPAHTPAPTTT